MDKNNEVNISRDNERFHIYHVILLETDITYAVRGKGCLEALKEIS